MSQLYEEKLSFSIPTSYVGTLFSFIENDRLLCISTAASNEIFDCTLNVKRSFVSSSSCLFLFIKSFHHQRRISNNVVKLFSS